MITSARGLPRRLGFSCVCAAWVPVAPAVGAVLPCLWLVPWRRCGMFTSTRLHVQKHLWHDRSKSSQAAAQEDAQQHTARTLKTLPKQKHSQQHRKRAYKTSKSMKVRCDVCVVSWFKLVGTIGIVLSVRHKHSKPATSALVRCMYSGLAGKLPFVPRAALLAQTAIVPTAHCADVYRVCVPLVVSRSSSCLLMPS